MGANRFARGGRREEQGHQSAGRRCGWRGLYDEPRPGAPRQIDAVVAEVVRQTLETTPRDARHWSLCSMAKAAGFARIDNSSDLEGLQSSTPSHRENRQAFANSLFVEEARDIVGLLLSLPNARSFCVSPRRARLRGWIDPSRCFPYARHKSSGAPTTICHGAFLFTALDAATGKVIERSLSASSRTRVPELPARAVQHHVPL